MSIAANSTNLHELLGLSPSDRIVSVCGAGGKTSLVFALARESASEGRRAAIMTTTHMADPTVDDVEIWKEETTGELSRIWNAGKIPAAGELLDEYRGFHPASKSGYRIAKDAADCIYIEADGARCLPFKYPHPWEPVIGHHSDAVVLVAGLSALGNPLEDVCYNAKGALTAVQTAVQTRALPEALLAALAESQPVLSSPAGSRPLISALADDRSQEGGLSSSLILDEPLMAAILALGYARYQPVVLLNQADTPELVARAEKVRTYLNACGIGRVQILSLKQMHADHPRPED